MQCKMLLQNNNLQFPQCYYSHYYYSLQFYLCENFFTSVIRDNFFIDWTFFHWQHFTTIVGNQMVPIQVNICIEYVQFYSFTIFFSIIELTCTALFWWETCSISVHKRFAICQNACVIVVRYKVSDGVMERQKNDWRNMVVAHYRKCETFVQYMYRVSQ